MSFNSRPEQPRQLRVDRWVCGSKKCGYFLEGSDEAKDLAARSAKLKDRPYKLSDGGGFYLYVSPAGGELRRWDYRADGKAKVPANTKVAAHHHAGNRVGTVLSGTWHFGYGLKYDEEGLRTLPTGSMYTEPDGVAHFARTGDSAVVVQLSGFGPTNTVYVNPADDPTKKH